MPEPVEQSPRRSRRGVEEARRLPVWLRIAGAAVAAVVFGYVLRRELAQPGRDYQTRQLEFASTDKPAFLGAGSRVLSVPLDKLDPTNGARVFELEFEPFPYNPALLTQARSIGFYFDLYTYSAATKAVSHRRARVQEAGFTAADGSVGFRAAPGVTLRSGELFELSRVGALPASTNQPARWRLRLVTDAPELVTLRCHVAASQTLAERLGHELGVLYHEAPAQPGQETNVINLCFPFGRYTVATGGEPPTRAELLAYLWQFRDGATTISTLANVAELLLFVGLAVFPWSGSRMTARAWWPPLMAGLGSAFVAGSLSLTHAILTPPFHGVDEAPHFFSYHTWMGDAQATEASWDLGKRGHVARLAFRTGQKFTAADVGRPAGYFILHPSTMDTHPEARSASAARLWQWTRSWIESRPVNEMMFRLRGLSVIVTALSFGIGAALLACARPQQPGTPWTAWLLLLVPSLPFFGMNLSNYPVQNAAGLVLATGLAMLLGRTRVPWLVGLVIGLSLGVALHTTIGAVPLAAGIAVTLLALPARALLPATSRDARRFREVAAFWFLLWIGLVSTRLLSNPAFDAATVERLKGFSERLHLQLIHSAPFWAVSLGVIAGYAALEYGALAIGGSDVGWRLGKLATKVSRRAWIGSVLVIIHLAGTAMRPCPQLGCLRETVSSWDTLPDAGLTRPLLQEVALPDEQPGAREYVTAVGRSFLASLGPGDRDFMLSTLFWGELGLLIPQTPNWLISALVTAFMGGLAALLWRCAKTGNPARLLQLLFIFAGLAVSLALYAFASQHSIAKPSLHGRYLIVCYLLLLTTCGFGWEFLAGGIQREHPALLWIASIAALLGVHLLSFRLVLERFF